MRTQTSMTQELQKMLRNQNYIVGPLDGIFGGLTRSALISYQKDSGRRPTGLVDSGTLHELRHKPLAQVSLPKELLPTQSAIWVELDKARLTLFVDGKYTGAFLVAIGKASTPSPFGLWRVVNKALNPGGDFGARWLGIDAPWGSYGVHGTNNPRIIGKQVSNGCVRMFNQDVSEVFEHVFVGARVLFTGNPYGTNVFDRTLRLGDMGSDVFLVQEQLQKLGLLSTSAEGIFGPGTVAALYKFQLQTGLAKTGVFDKATRAKMFGPVGRKAR